MSKYRFVTPHRCGKWYPELTLAQRFASTIGAGFLERRSGRFYPYAGTRLEVAEDLLAPPGMAGPDPVQRGLGG